MPWPIILRSEYDAKIKELQQRIYDLERHFVTKRDEKGTVIETLADVPIEKRNPLRPLRGRNWNQLKNWLEMTDGGRHV